MKWEGENLFTEVLQTKSIEEPLTAMARSSSARAARNALYRQFMSKLVVNSDLTRQLVSFQSNKKTPFYRWLKYKEAFSHEFVAHILDRFRPIDRVMPRVLDPFAGAGTTLTTATKRGWHATGIELLPVGTAGMRARLVADSVDLRKFDAEFARLTDRLLANDAVVTSGVTQGYRFPHLRITAQAFPTVTESALSAYMIFVDQIADADVRYLFWFAALSILEDVSYTRKDGQYLRWDHRSGRALRSTFNKGPIRDFFPALHEKLRTFGEDLSRRNGGSFSRNVEIIDGSCLDTLPVLSGDTFDLVLTSPPYCNRYDYTRTYALELAFLNHGEDAVGRLRQTLLSATVENKTKRKFLASAYAARRRTDRYRQAEAAFEDEGALHEVLALLRAARARDELNNHNIPTMVENYFFEMNLVVRELARVLAPGGRIVMVNDNVQYHGEDVPVDLILSSFAVDAGLSVDAIWVLPRGKGNSSQQMGAHGRNELRKCVYVWSKAA